MTIQMDSGNVHWRESYRTYWCYICKCSTPYEHRCLNCEDKKLISEKSMTINELVEKVRDFQESKGFPTSVELSDVSTLMYRNSLLIEGIAELFQAICKKDRVEIADGLADVLYLVLGTCGMLDIPIDAVLEEVHRSNMTKGKWAVKGKDYEPPRIKEILERKN